MDDHEEQLPDSIVLEQLPAHRWSCRACGASGALEVTAEFAADAAGEHSCRT